jgi:hypothetical protein
MLLARRCSAHVSELNRPIVAMVVVVEDIDVLREIEMNIIIVKKRFLESIFNWCPRGIASRMNGPYELGVS